MEKLIVYGSQYGTTKRYAEKFSEITVARKHKVNHCYRWTCRCNK